MASALARTTRLSPRKHHQPGNYAPREPPPVDTARIRSIILTGDRARGNKRTLNAHSRVNSSFHQQAPSRQAYEEVGQPGGASGTNIYHVIPGHYARLLVIINYNL